MPHCLICLNDCSAEAHPDCVEGLFGTRQLPALDLDLSKLYGLAATKMAGKMSISGVQEKVSLVLSDDRTRLDVAASGGRYILKPETSRFAAIPQNEQVTMRMAPLVGIEIPPCGLLRLADDSLAFVIKRFDRPDHGGKLAVEDFCQLSGQPLRGKYEGSAEGCVRVVRKFASEPLVEVQKLYRQFLFSWWVANGDLHLKNLSLLTTPQRIHRLAPAYDLVCTKLVIPDDTLSLPIGGRNKDLTRRHWLEFAAYCQIPERAARRLLAQQIDAFDEAAELVGRSFLTSEMRNRYLEVLRQNTSTLAA